MNIMKLHIIIISFFGVMKFAHNQYALAVYKALESIILKPMHLRVFTFKLCY